MGSSYRKINKKCEWAFLELVMQMRKQCYSDVDTLALMNQRQKDLIRTMPNDSDKVFPDVNDIYFIGFCIRWAQALNKLPKGRRFEILSMDDLNYFAKLVSKHLYNYTH